MLSEELGAVTQLMARGNMKRMQACENENGIDSAALMKNASMTLDLTIKIIYAYEEAQERILELYEEDAGNAEDES